MDDVTTIIQAFKGLADKLGENRSEKKDKDPFAPKEGTGSDAKAAYTTQAKIDADEHFKAKEKYDDSRKPPRKVIDEKPQSNQDILDALKGIGISLDSRLGDVREKQVEKDAGMGWMGMTLIGTAILASLRAISTVFVAITEFARVLFKSKPIKWLRSKAMKFVRWIGRGLVWPFQKLFELLKALKGKILKSKWYLHAISLVDDMNLAFKRLKTSLMNNKWIKNITTWWSTSIQPLFTNFKKTVGGWLNGASTWFSDLGKPGGAFSRVKDFFINMKKYLPKPEVMAKITKAGKLLGRILGKIFWPITVVIGIIDGVIGFMDGYKEDGIIGGIKEGIKGIFHGIIGNLLEILDDILIWVAEAFGMDNLAKAINFAGILDGFYQVWDGLVDIIGGILTLDLDRIMAGGEDIIMGATNWLVQMVRSGAEMFINTIKDIFGINPDEFWSFDEWIEDTSTAVSDWFDDIGLAIDQGLDQLTEMVTGWITWLSTGFEDMSTSISNFFGDLKRSFDENLAIMRLMVTSSVIYISSKYREYKKRIKDKIQEYIDSIAKFFDNVKLWWTETKADAKKNWDETSKAIQEFFSGIGTYISESWTTTKENIKKSWDMFANLWRDPGKFIDDFTPEWMKDFGKWMGAKLDPLFQAITDIFNTVGNFDFVGFAKNKIKDISETAYDMIWGDEDKAKAAAAAKVKEVASQTGISVLDLGAISKAESKRSNEDTYADRLAKDTQGLQDRIEKVSKESKGNAKDFRSGLHSADRSRLLEGHGLKEGSAQAMKFWETMAGQYSHEFLIGSDDREDSGADFHNNAALTAIAHRTNMKIQERSQNTFLKAIKKTGSFKLGGVQIRVDGGEIAAVQKNVPEIIREYHGFEPKGKLENAFFAAVNELGLKRWVQNEAQKLRNKPLDGQMTRQQAPDRLGSFFDHKDPALKEPELQDFIWRPGEEPKSFSKGDILIGAHSDYNKRELAPRAQPRSSNTDKDLIKRVDNLAIIMAQTSNIHKETLEVLKTTNVTGDTGGNSAVMGNNSNNTTVNNVQSSPDIMKFREQVLGRLG